MEENTAKEEGNENHHSEQKSWKLLLQNEKLSLTSEQHYPNPEEKLKARRLRKRDSQRRYVIRLKQKIVGTQENTNKELKAGESFAQYSAIKKDQNMAERKSFELLNLTQEQKEASTSTDQRIADIRSETEEVEKDSESFKLIVAQRQKERFKKRWSSFTPEEREAYRLKRNKHQREYRQRRREREASLRKKSWELLLQNEELSLEEKEFLRSRQQQKAKQQAKLRIASKQDYPNPEEKLKARRLRQSDAQRRYIVRLQQKIIGTQGNTIKELKAGEFFVQCSAIKKEQNMAERKSFELLNLTQEQKEASEQHYPNPEEKLKARRLRKRDSQRRYVIRLKQKIVGTQENTNKELKAGDSFAQYSGIKKEENLSESKSFELVNLAQEQKETLTSIDQRIADIRSETEEVEKKDSESFKLSVAQRQKERFEKRWSSFTPEERQAYRLKRNQHQREYRQNRKIKEPPEKKEARRMITLEYRRKYRERRLEREPSFRKNEWKLLLQKEKLALEEKEFFRSRDQLLEAEQAIQKTASEQHYPNPEEKLKARRLRKREAQRRYLIRLKQKTVGTQENTVKELKAVESIVQYSGIEEKENLKKDVTIPSAESDHAAWLRTNYQPTSSFPPIVEDEIEIEKKVIQQNLIKTIPKRLTETLNDSSCSWLQPSQESFSTDGTHTFHGDSTISKSFLDGSSSHHSNKIERRKTVIDESFSCMRAVIDATAKGDRFVMFGKHIAQKIRSHKKGEAEINIAKLLIDNVLQNLSIGIYKSEI